MTTSGSAVSKRNILERYRFLRDDHLRYMAKWGLIRPVRSGGDTHYAFQDLALLRQADAELAEGVAFRAVLRNLLAAFVRDLGAPAHAAISSASTAHV